MAASPTTHVIQGLLTPPHACGYLPGHSARSFFLDPDWSLDAQAYQVLIDSGFRRSGSHYYRPQCPDCRACRSLRVPVDSFQPNRSQRRTLARCAPLLDMRRHPLDQADTWFPLYQNYLRARHSDSDMADDITAYRRFIGVGDPQVEAFSQLLVHSLDDRVILVAVTDRLPLGLSSVYTFFDPEYAELSLGRYSILSQIHLAQSLGIPYLYLGYWIADCRKMRYKADYQPAEIHGPLGWEPGPARHPKSDG